MSFRRLKVLFFLTGATFGCIWPFVALLLLDGGLDAVAIGTVLGASAAVSLLAYPAWGLLADGPLGRERSVAAAGLVAAAIGVFLLVVHRDPLLLGVGIALLPLGFAPWEPVTDAIALQALGEGARAYGRFRLWTSVGWAATSLAGGVLYVAFGGDALLVTFVAGSLVITAVTARPRGGRSWHRVTSNRRPLIPELRRAIVVAPVLVPVLAAVFLEWLGNSAMNAFLPLRIIDVGGGAILIGIAAAVPAIVEAPLFPTTGWISDRLGLRGLYVLGLVMSAGVMAFIAAAQDPVLVSVARAVDGVSYVLRYAGIVLIVGAVLPHALRATGQSLARLVGGGLAAIVAGPFAGAVYEAFGGTALFLSCAGIIGLGALIAWRGLRGPAFGPGARVAAATPVIEPASELVEP